MLGDMESRYYLVQDEIKKIMKQLERLKYLIDEKDQDTIKELKIKFDELYKKYEF
jgi:predicted nuclease with TOPRIM domain